MLKYLTWLALLLAVLAISFELLRPRARQVVMPSLPPPPAMIYVPELPPVAEEEPEAKEVVRKMIVPAMSVKIPSAAYFSGESVPLDTFYVREGFERELIVNTYFHSSTLMLMKKAHRWFPVIEPILAKHNIPEDFKFIALIESGLDNVTSPAGASGFWQFLKGTARDYNLEVNDHIDERYHVEKATEAACRFFLDAYGTFGNWTLVAAAFNAGPKRIGDMLKRQHVSSYYDLQIPEETNRYVYRILAVKTIFANPTSYGFHVKFDELYPIVPTRDVVVNHTVKDLVIFAQQYGISYKTLRIFNPWIRKDELPNQSGRAYILKIPDADHLRYSTLGDEPLPEAAKNTINP
ncbi:MAG: lytic transglycosylase domain-containing protein [Clostridia bacterium]|nr:lytic transglycosylase domain-containing protein [Clostridia bacterium]